MLFTFVDEYQKAKSEQQQKDLVKRKPGVPRFSRPRPTSALPTTQKKGFLPPPNLSASPEKGPPAARYMIPT